MFEIEQKYRIEHPRDIRKRIVRLGGKKIHSGLEINELYDYKGRLRKNGCVLRLRLYGGGKGKLTFKGPRQPHGRYKRRVEIETPVDFDKARLILKAMRYKKMTGYKKEREEFSLGGCYVCLDKLKKHGWFVEIEGSEKRIDALARRLGLTEEQEEHRTYLQILGKK